MKEKEPEFIVSTEELKKNQERYNQNQHAQHAEKYYKSKKIKESIITIIIFVLAIVMIVLLVSFLNDYSAKEIKHCVESGNSEYFCKSNL